MPDPSDLFANPGADQLAPAGHRDDFDDWTVAELDDYIDEWELEVPKSLNKSEKIDAIRAAVSEED